MVVTPDVVTSFLGVPRFEYEELEERTRVPGVAVGLAWTPAGGDILFIEATRMKGARTLMLTGQLGDVMKESAQAALSWVRSHATELGISSSFWETRHSRHLPAGALRRRAFRHHDATAWSRLLTAGAFPRGWRCCEVTSRAGLPVGDQGKVLAHTDRGAHAHPPRRNGRICCRTCRARCAT